MIYGSRRRFDWRRMFNSGRIATPITLGSSRCPIIASTTTTNNARAPPGKNRKKPSINSTKKLGISPGEESPI